MKILIVEDDFASRNILQFVLAPYGEVFIAIDGKEAVGAVQQALSEESQYDLIFMDIMMPEMDGLEAVELIRDLEKMHGISPRDEAPIIMVTAMSDPKTVFKAYKDSGATEYIVKPVMVDTLKQKLATLGIEPKEGGA